MYTGFPGVNVLKPGRQQYNHSQDLLLRSASKVVTGMLPEQFHSCIPNVGTYKQERIHKA